MQETSVVIVGGGPVGLVCSILLSLKGIRSVLLERQPGTSIHPKAAGLNQRTIEIFRRIGIEDEVLRQSAPPESFSRTAWFTSLGPDGREICRREAWGGGKYAERYARASPCRYATLPQIRLEPILRKRAEELNPGGIFYHHEVEDVSEHKAGVTVLYHSREGGDSEQQTIIAKYALGCDGGRFLADSMNIPFTGESDIIDMVSVHFHAPISQHRDLNHFISWFVNPELGGSLKTGYLYHLGPYPMQLETEEWMFACARLPHEQMSSFTEEDMLARLHRTLMIPDLDVELFSLSHWFINAKVASHYITPRGRIFLVGDAAHRVPPWGSLGFNSGIQDAENLIWKLALQLKRPDMNLENLLASYDTERRPIGERVARTSLYNMRSHALVLDTALGLTPDQSAKDNMRAMDEYFDPANLADGEARRQAVQSALKTLDIEFYAHGAEVGWFYDFGALLKSPQINRNGEMELCVYRPTALPGHQLPHAWLTNSGGERRSTREFATGDRLALIAKSASWAKFESDLVNVVYVGEGNGCWSDVDGTWEEQCRFGNASGAVLVRPDNIVACRFDDYFRMHGIPSKINQMVRQALYL